MEPKSYPLTYYIDRFYFKKNKFWMFKLMGIYTFNKNLFDFKNQSFFKLLGTGSKNGFSVFPDFSNYVVISSWKNDKDREKFLQTNKVINNVIKKCSERIEIKIDPYESKGSWDKLNPFKNNSKYNNERILIITRARVKFKKIIDFFINTSKLITLSFSIRSSQSSLSSYLLFESWEAPSKRITSENIISLLEISKIEFSLYFETRYLLLFLSYED